MLDVLNSEFCRSHFSLCAAFMIFAHLMHHLVIVTPMMKAYHRSHNLLHLIGTVLLFLLIFSLSEVWSASPLCAFSYHCTVLCASLLPALFLWTYYVSVASLLFLIYINISAVLTPGSSLEFRDFYLLLHSSSTVVISSIFAISTQSSTPI